MKENHRIFTCARLLCALLFSPLAAAAPPPPLLGFQGRMVDPATGMNKPDGVYSTAFRLYQNSAGGVAAWTETQNVTVDNGYFSVLLGNSTPISATDFDLYNVWLGIEIAGDGEMVPRHRLSYSPYAISAVTLQGGYGPEAFYKRNSAESSSVSSSQPTLFLTHTANQPALELSSQVTSGGKGALRSVAGTASATIINSAAAVLGTSQDQRGVIGISDANDGLFGWTNEPNAAGVRGQTINGTGVSAFSQNGTALEVLGSAKISGTLTAPHARTVSWPANSLNYVPGSVVTQDKRGLRFTNSFVEAAYLEIAPPQDWDGTSDVTMKLLFFPTSNTAGKIGFFIRPRGRAPGEYNGDAAGVTGTAQTSVGENVFLEQSFTIPASKFGTKPYWIITVQRDSTVASPYPDPVVLSIVSLNYNATR